MPLFEVAIIELPTKKDAEEGTGKERLVLAPKCVLAKDAQTAGIMAVQGDKPLEVDFARMQVLIRPFA